MKVKCINNNGVENDMSLDKIYDAEYHKNTLIVVDGKNFCKDRFEITEEPKNLGIKGLIKQAHENAKAHGFWNDITKANGEIEPKVIVNGNTANVYISQFLLLIIGEVSEATEALRKLNSENFSEELADVAIRLFDLAGGLDIDLETEIIKKMEKNKARPWKHGKEF